MGVGGEIFVLDMGEPVKIRYLAEQMIRLSGKVPAEDIEIVYTGLRPGEKMFEELFHAQEQLVGTDHEKIFLSRHRDVDWQQLDEIYGVLETACRGGDERRLLQIMNKLMPEFVCGPCAANPAPLAQSDKVLALPASRG
jgi:FlaA1/EpsC-like NDP-sugar epimerase